MYNTRQCLVYPAILGACVLAAAVQGFGCDQCAGVSFGLAPQNPPPVLEGQDIFYLTVYVNGVPGSACCAADYEGSVQLPDGTFLPLAPATLQDGETTLNTSGPYTVSGDPVQTAWAFVQVDGVEQVRSYPLTPGSSLEQLTMVIEHWGEAYSGADVDGVSPVNVQDLVQVLLAWE